MMFVVLDVSVVALFSMMKRTKKNTQRERQLEIYRSAGPVGEAYDRMANQYRLCPAPRSY
jgi:hypothetical protein